MGEVGEWDEDGLIKASKGMSVATIRLDCRRSLSLTEARSSRAMPPTTTFGTLLFNLAAVRLRDVVRAVDNRAREHSLAISKAL